MRKHCRKHVVSENTGRRLCFTTRRPRRRRIRRAAQGRAGQSRKGGRQGQSSIIATYVHYTPQGSLTPVFSPPSLLASPISYPVSIHLLRSDFCSRRPPRYPRAAEGTAPKYTPPSRIPPPSLRLPKSGVCSRKKEKKPPSSQSPI